MEEEPGVSPVQIIDNDNKEEDAELDEKPAPPGGYYALAVLTGINLFNYIDRYVPSATKDLFKEDLNLNDTETSIPLTAFIVVYLICSPIFGTLADKGFSRKLLIAIGIVVWSLATAAAFFAQDFASFLIFRMVVGIGESAYATITPALLSDFFPRARRNKVLTIFYVAIPVGAAIGYGLGGAIGDALGWRYAFLICGLPGIVLAFLCLKIRDPGAGYYEKKKPISQPWLTTIRILLKNKLWMNSLIGYTAVTFAAGGMADWMPTYMSRVTGSDVADSGFAVGAVTVAGGLGGTIAGGVLAEKLKPYTRLPYLCVSSVSILPCFICCIIMLYATENYYAITFLLFAAQFFLWMYSGPINTVQANAVSADIRARAFGLSITVIHLLGDAISPTIIGAISDADSLRTAVILIPITIGIGGIVWGLGWRLLPDVARVAIPSDSNSSSDTTPFRPHEG